MELVRPRTPRGHVFPSRRMAGRAAPSLRPPHALPARGAQRRGRGVLPLAEVKSLLFGHALVSTPFCVYGGIVAADEAAHARAGDGRPATSRARSRRRSPRDAQPAAPSSRLAVQGSLRHLPQADRRRLREEHARHPAQAAGDGAQGHQGGTAGGSRYGRRPALRHVLREPAQPRHAGVRASATSRSSRRRSARPATSSPSSRAIAPWPAC